MELTVFASPEVARPGTADAIWTQLCQHLASSGFESLLWTTWCRLQTTLAFFIRRSSDDVSDVDFLPVSLARLLFASTGRYNLLTPHIATVRQWLGVRQSCCVSISTLEWLTWRRWSTATSASSSSTRSWGPLLLSYRASVHASTHRDRALGPLTICLDAPTRWSCLPTGRWRQTHEPSDRQVQVD